MRLRVLASTLSLLTVIGCSSSSSSERDKEKQDQDEFRLEELAGDELDSMLGAAVVESVAYKYIDTSTETTSGYVQQIKLYCTQTGGHVAPIECFLGVLNVGEGSGAYKAYKVGGNLQSEAQNVQIEIAGATAKVSWRGTTAVFADTQDYVEMDYTAKVALSGNVDEPKVDVSLACTLKGGGACPSADLKEVNLEESDAWQAAAVDFVKYDHIETGTDEKPDGYHQQIKLLCNDWGGDITPMVCYVGVLPVEELGGAYKIFRVAETLLGDATDAAITIAGSGARVTWKGAIPNWEDVNGGSLTTSYAVGIELAGSFEEPQVKTTFSREVK